MKTIILISFLSLLLNKDKEILDSKNSIYKIQTIREIVYTDRKTKEIINKKEQELGLDRNSLYKIIYIESRFNPTAYNTYTGAYGLLQIIPSTLENLGYSLTNYVSMDFNEQLNGPITKYIKYWKKYYDIKTELDLKLVVFYPLALKYKENKDYIIGSEKSFKYAKKVAKWNHLYDLNKDGFITIKEIEQYEP